MNWAGEMFVNYMDYSDDADVTMFTIGQNAVMRIASLLLVVRPLD